VYNVFPETKAKSETSDFDEDGVNEAVSLQLDVIGYVEPVVNVVPAPPFKAYEAVNELEANDDETVFS
jgi:hypothetical protein